MHQTLHICRWALRF